MNSLYEMIKDTMNKQFQIVLKFNIVTKKKKNDKLNKLNCKIEMKDIHIIMNR